MAEGNIGWRVLADGAMIEVKTGERKDASGTREMTTIRIMREGRLIEPPETLTDGFIARYDAGEDFAHSIVERVSISVDEDGNKTATPAGAEASSDPVDKDAIARAETAESEATSLRSTVSSLENSVSAMTEQRDAAISALEDSRTRVRELDAELEEATKPQPIDYDKLSAAAVEAEAKDRNLTVTGTGKDGNVLKKDNVKALQEDDAKSA